MQKGRKNAPRFIFLVVPFSFHYFGKFCVSSFANAKTQKMLFSEVKNSCCLVFYCQNVSPKGLESPVMEVFWRLNLALLEVNSRGDKLICPRIWQKNRNGINVLKWHLSGQVYQFGKSALKLKFAIKPKIWKRDFFSSEGEKITREKFCPRREKEKKSFFRLVKSIFTLLEGGVGGIEAWYSSSSLLFLLPFQANSSSIRAKTARLSCRGSKIEEAAVSQTPLHSSDLLCSTWKPGKIFREGPRPSSSAQRFPPWMTSGRVARARF